MKRKIWLSAAVISFIGFLMTLIALVSIFVSTQVAQRFILPTDYAYEFSGPAGPPDIGTIVEHAAKPLTPQLISGTISQLSWGTVNNKIGTPFDTWPRWLAIDLSWVYDRFLDHYGYAPMGAFTLFGYNFDLLETKEQLASYTAFLKRKYALHLSFRNLADGITYEVRIDPLLSSDCVPNNVPIHYCRYLPDDPFETLKTRPKTWTEAADQYQAVAQRYKGFKLDTPLGPAVDISEGSTIPSVSMSDYARIASKHLIDQNIIPTLKHFAYAPGETDTHYESYVDPRTLDELEKNDFLPYFAVEDIGEPYFLMVTHQTLTALDEDRIITKSDLASKYIHKNFPNAVILVDEISMLGFDRKADFEQRVREVRGDMFIVHSGLLDPWFRRAAIYRGLYQRNPTSVQESLKRILVLKKRYGLMKIMKKVSDNSTSK